MSERAKSRRHRCRYRIERNNNSAGAGLGFARNKVRVVSRFRTSVSVEFNPILTQQPPDVSGFHVARALTRLDGSFSSRRKRALRFFRATVVSRIQRRNGLRWNALLMSLIELLSHDLPESGPHISCDRL